MGTSSVATALASGAVSWSVSLPKVAYSRLIALVSANFVSATDVLGNLEMLEKLVSTVVPVYLNPE